MNPMRLEVVLKRALECAADERSDAAWQAIAPVLAVALAPGSNAELAASVARNVVGEPAFEHSGRLELARRLLGRWPTDFGVLIALARATESLVDMRFLNAAPPDDPYFHQLANALCDIADAAVSDDQSITAARAISVVARVCGRAWDDACEQAHQVVLAKDPSWQAWYDYGLFLKTRGRFREGFQANLRARDRGGESDEAAQWNLGICATGAGEGETALLVWRGIGCKVELGEDGLPTGSWPHVEVRLAERPIAERSAEADDPGEEETVWVRRLSPCHGEIISPTFGELGADYGDIVLFDGAAIVVRERAGKRVAVFPQLATIRRGAAQLFRFAARQARPGMVAELQLPGDSILYVHTEQVRQLCRGCWETGADHDHSPEDHGVVTGKLVVPEGADLRAVASALGERMEGVVVHVPNLWQALGDTERARIEQARLGQLTADA